MITTQINGRTINNFKRVGWIGFENLESVDLEVYKSTFIDLGNEYSKLIPSVNYQFVDFGGYGFYSLDGGCIYSPSSNSSGDKRIFTPIASNDDTSHPYVCWSFKYSWQESIPSSGTFTLYPRFGVTKDDIYAVSIRLEISGFKDFLYITVPQSATGLGINIGEGPVSNGSNIKIGAIPQNADSFGNYMRKPRYRSIDFYECSTAQYTGVTANNTKAMNLNWETYPFVSKGNLVTSLVPVVLSDGTAGLYDERIGKFYGTEGPGRVLYGN